MAMLEGLAPGEFLDNILLFVARDGTQFGDFNGNGLDLFGFELAHQLAGQVVRQAHEQNGRFAEVQRHGACCEED